MSIPEKPFSSSTIVLGIDPGTLISGYGVIHVENQRYTALDYGCIRPPPHLKLSERYLIIFDSIEALIERHRPVVLVVEGQYVSKNPQSALKLGTAKGMAIIAAKKRGLPVYEYTPSVAKRAVVGRGGASKFQVQGMVKNLLNLAELPQPEDAADALALAICYAQAAAHLRAKNEI